MSFPGKGLLKGLAVTMRTMTKRSVTAHYPDALPELPPRSRGVIALIEENCTVCMLRPRVPACIYIDSHKDTIPATTEGGRDKSRNVLDRFAIDLDLHVLLDLRGGLPLRRAALEPGVRVRRARHPRADPRRSGCGWMWTVHRPRSTRAPRRRSPLRRRPRSGRTADAVTVVEVLFLLLGLVAVGSALLVVTTRTMVHAALWLVVTLGAVAGIFLLLAAEFVAWVQILIYVGAVVVLLLFALMLTKAPTGP